MKKWISLLFVLIFVLSFAACNTKNESRRPDSPVFRTNVTTPNAVQPDTAQSDTVQPDAAQSDTVQSDIAQSDTVQSDMIQPDTSQSDISTPDVSQSDASQADTSGDVYKEESPVQNSPANEEFHTGSVSLVNPISVYLADSGLAQEMIFPSGADGAVVQNGELHFNPHGEDAQIWFEQIEMAAAIVSDDGTIQGTAQTGVTYTIGGTPFTVTCTTASDEDWYLVIS